MIGHRVRALRQSRGWTQAHLAEASGVSERTIQRIETRHSYSGETAMALAAALGVPITDLTAPSSSSPGEHRPLWPALSPRVASLIALLLAFPGALFIVANTLGQAGIWPGPIQLLDAVGRASGLVPTYWYLWPLPLIAAPAIGGILVAASLVRLKGRLEGREVTVTGIELSWHPLAFAALLFCAATMFAPTANMFGDMVARAAHAPLD